MYEELEQVLNYSANYHTKILLGDFNAKVGRENIFTPTILNEDSKNNGVKIVNFATSKNLVVKSMMFVHQKIHKYTWTPPDGMTHNLIVHILIGDGNQVYSMYDLSGELTVILITI